MRLCSRSIAPVSSGPPDSKLRAMAPRSTDNAAPEDLTVRAGGHRLAVKCSARERDTRRRARMRITYFSSTGVGDPTRATIPLHLAASGSLEVGQEPTIVLTGDGTELVLDDNAERMEG